MTERTPKLVRLSDGRTVVFPVLVLPPQGRPEGGRTAAPRPQNELASGQRRRLGATTADDEAA